MRILRYATIATLLLLPFIFIACNKSTTDESAPQAKSSAKKEVRDNPFKNEVYVSLTDEEVDTLMRIARKAFDMHVKEGKRYEPTNGELSGSLKNKRGNHVFATIYYKGDWRGCMASSRKLLVDSVIDSVINTAQDFRFKKKNPKPEELQDYRVELSILQPKHIIEGGNTIENIEKQFKPGVEGLYVGDGRKSAFFLPYVFNKKARKLQTWLERLSNKATGQKNPDLWKNADAIIAHYDAINTIEEKPYGKFTYLYRYRVLAPTVSAKQIHAALHEGINWLSSQYDGAAGMLKPGYYEYTTRPIKNHNMVDEARALWSLVKLHSLIPDATATKLIDSFLPHLLDATDKDRGLLMKQRKNREPLPDVIASLFLFNSVITYDNGSLIKKHRKWLDTVAAWLTKDIVRQSGQIDLKGTYYNAGDSDYVAGLVLESLSIAAKPLKSEALRKAAERLNGYIFTSFKPNPNSLYTDLAEGYRAYYALTDDSNAYDKLIGIVDATIRLQLKGADARLLDLSGAVKSGRQVRTIDTANAVVLWSHAYEMMKSDSSLKENAWRQSVFNQLGAAIAEASRWLYEHQANYVNTFFFPESRNVIGGFFMEEGQFQVRPGVSARCLEALALIVTGYGDNGYDELMKANTELLNRPSH